ncbi:glycosyl hydrolase family 71-domain-containing protein [Aspergillus similis]
MPSSRTWGLPILTLLSYPAAIESKAVLPILWYPVLTHASIDDIALAKAAHIDAFALNAGYGQDESARSFHNAFTVASELDFKLFFSLDCSSDGHWPKDQVISLLENYTTNEAYFRHTDGRALVGTCEGFEAANDWPEIKKEVARAVGNETCCVLIPDWASAGPEEVAKVSAIDGLMSWEAWPYGDEKMSTTRDEEYMWFLGERSYIMPGDDLWYTRWQQVLELQLAYVEILTWNDYGESHYIGPLRRDATGVIAEGAPFDYVRGMEHDGWSRLLPYLIAKYKNGKNGKNGKDIDIEEALSVSYQLLSADACDSGKTSGNSETSHQAVMRPGDILQDRIFLLSRARGGCRLAIAVGDVNQSAQWTDTPDGARGVYHGSTPFGGRVGEVVVTLSRAEKVLAQMKGRAIDDRYLADHTNWNAWVGNATAVKRGGGGMGDGDEVGDTETGNGMAIQRASLWLTGLAFLSYLI